MRRRRCGGKEKRKETELLMVESTSKGLRGWGVGREFGFGTEREGEDVLDGGEGVEKRVMIEVDSTVVGSTQKPLI